MKEIEQNYEKKLKKISMERLLEEGALLITDFREDLPKLIK